MSTPEELLAQILKANKKIAFGQTIGTNADGNCTVQTEDGSILARSPGQISAGSCVALRADDGQWYAVSARETGLVQRSVLYSRKNRANEEEEITSSFIGAGGGLIVGTDGDVVIPQFVPEGFIGYVWVGDISKTDDSHEYYAIYGKRTNGETEPPLYTMRFSHIVDGEEITYKEITNIIFSYSTDSVRSDEEPFTETIYGASFIVTGGVDGFFRFYTYSITYVTNYNNSDFDEVIGFKDSSFQNGFMGFVDLNTNEANRFAVSIPDHVIPENTEENYFFLPEIQTPMPSPINTAAGRFSFGQWGRESGQDWGVSFGTSDFIIAKNSQYLFAGNYRDYNLRFYNGTTFTSVPTSFFQYTSPDPSPSFKVQFGNPYRSIQITNEGTIVRLLGITDDNLLIYITRAITDTEWSDFQEVEVPDFVDPPSFYETVYLELDSIA